MKNATLVLLCCSAMLTACDDAKDATKRASEEATSSLDSALESTKDAAKDAASDAMASEKGLKETVVDSTAAVVDTAKDISSAAVEKTTAVIASIAGDAAKKGQNVYKRTCSACHGSGAAGAPKLGDKAAWSDRIAQGNDVMTQHAIEGFKGDTGYMPPKGGAMQLSDEDVAAAVKYMASQVE